MEKVLKLTVLIVTCVCAGALAGTLVWSPSQDGLEWQTTGAWDLGYAPLAGDIANINSEYSCEVGSATNALKELNMGNSATAVLNINSGGVLNMGGGGHINIGRNGHSELNVYDGGSVICENGARISVSWSADAVINQYGGHVEPHTLLNLADNSVYNMMGGKIAILGSKGNASLTVGNNNLNHDAFFNLSDGEVEFIGSGWLALGRDDRNGGKGTVNQTGGYMNLSASDINVFLGRETGTVGIYNLSGGTFDVKELILVGNLGYGELNISGGTLNASNTVRLGVGEDAQGIVTISGGSVNIGGYLQASDPVSGATDPNQYAELNIIGSQTENITVGGRLDFRNKYNSKINFVFDAGGITPIHTADHSVLEGTAITVDVAQGATLAIGTEIDVIVSDATVAMNETTTVINNHEYYQFSYEVVSLAGGGQALRFTVTGIEFDSCEDAINAGYKLPGDINLDCMVDLADIAIMAEYWFACNDPSGENCN